MTAEQYLGDVQTAPARRLGIHRPFQQTLVAGAVGLLDQRLRIADHPGQQSNYSLDHHHRRHLAATQHVIANTELVDAQSPSSVLDDASVNALVATTGEDQVSLLG